MRKMYSARLAELEDYVSGLKNDNSLKDNVISELESTVNHVMTQSQRRATLFDDEIEKMSSKHAAEVSGLRRRLEENMNVDDDPDSIHGRRRGSFSELEQQLQSREKELMAVKAQLESKNHDLEAAQHVVRRLRKGSMDITRLKEGAESIREKLQEESQRSEELAMQLATREEEMEIISVERDDLREQVDTLNRDLNDIRKEISALQERYEDLENTTAAASSVQDKLARHREEYELREKSLKERSFAMAKKIESSRAEIAELQAQIQRQDDEISSLRDHPVSLKASMFLICSSFVSPILFATD